MFGYSFRVQFTALRSLAILLILAASGLAEVDLALVDGRVLRDVTLTGGDATSLRVRYRGNERTIPTQDLVQITAARGALITPAKTYNLYLHNGDRLRGKVTGANTALTLDAETVRGLSVALAEVRGVRYGRIVALHLQDKYTAAFLRAMKAGDNTVIALRDKFPTPIRARVLEAGASSVTALVRDVRQVLPAEKVYGFVLAREADPEFGAGIRMRVHLRDGGRITLPFERIDEKAVYGGGATIKRGSVARIEFLGEHIAHLSDFDPIDVKQRALFGKPRAWRKDGMVLGGPLRMNGTTYVRGIGTQSYARLEYVLGGQWSALFVRCGIDDAAGPEGDAVFRILGDGKLLKEVRCRAQERPVALTLNVKGVDRLVLEAVPGDSYVSDFCNWADARVFTTDARKED